MSSMNDAGILLVSIKRRKLLLRIGDVPNCVLSQKFQMRKSVLKLLNIIKVSTISSLLLILQVTPHTNSKLFGALKLEI